MNAGRWLKGVCHVQVNSSPEAQADFAERQQEKASGVPEEGPAMAADLEQAYSSQSEVCS